MCTGNTFSLYFCPITNHGVVKYVLTSVGQFSEWVTYSLDISPGYVFIYPLVLKISDNQFWYITMVFKKKNRSQRSGQRTVDLLLILSWKPLVLWGFWQNWNWWFFETEFFQRTENSGFFILNFFWTRASGSSKKFKEPPNTAGTDQPLVSTYLRVTNFLNNCLHTVVQWQVQHFSVWIFLFFLKIWCWKIKYFQIF
jgi:hypothetical protein